MARFSLTVSRVVKEDHQMTIEADTAMQAYDEVQKLVELRNKNSTVGKYAVVKVKREESHE